MEVTSPSTASVSPSATKGALPVFPWSRTQAVTLLTRFIASALAACIFAVLAWLAPAQTPAVVFLALGLVLGAAEVAGIALCTVEWRDYGWRALSRGAEVWPALAAACLEPAAILAAVILIVYTLIASGVYTVALARGTAAGRIRGEAARRLVVAPANFGFIALVLSRTQGWGLEQAMGVDGRALVLACVALVLIASSRAAVDIALWARSGN